MHIGMRVGLGSRNAYRLRNLLTNSKLLGAVAGTPGTAATSWTLFSAGGTTTVSAGISGGNKVGLSATSLRQGYQQSATFLNNTTYTLSAAIEVSSGTTTISNMLNILGTVTGVTLTYKVDGATVASGNVPAVGAHIIEVIAAFTTGHSGNVIRFGIGVAGNATGDISFDGVQLEIGSARTGYQAT